MYVCVGCYTLLLYSYRLGVLFVIYSWYIGVFFVSKSVLDRLVLVYMG